MPTYDYQCEACGCVKEVFHAMTASGPEFCDCPQQGRLHRLLSAGTGLIFKGSGFYITDYCRKNESAGTSSGASTSEATAKADAATPKADSTTASPCAKASCDTAAKTKTPPTTPSA